MRLSRTKAEVETYVEQMLTLLRPEVLAGHFEPRLYATFYDNMQGKILRRSQLYGTNQVFNPKTRQVEPPWIEDIEKDEQGSERDRTLAPQGGRVPNPQDALTLSNQERFS